MPFHKSNDSGSSGGGHFATTHWSIILAAGSPESSRYSEALEVLCQTYWFPLYAYLRRRGYDTHLAEDYTQAFFAQMLEKQYLRNVKPAPGRFRSFLLTALKRFIADQHDRTQAVKRGGGRKLLSLDIDAAESRYGLEPVSKLSPEKVFEKSWALTVLEKAMLRIETEFTDSDKQGLFDRLSVYLAGKTDAIAYRDVAIELDMTEDAVKSAVYRLRKRYREILRDEIAQTVSSSDQIDEEIRGLFTALAY
ncbi:RNA polymerase sigma factor [Planctomycetota bacterium]